MSMSDYRRGTGPLDALVSYWLTKMSYDDNGDAAPPEFNLPNGGAARALEAVVGIRDSDLDMDASTAFELGLVLADIVSKNPLDAGPAVRDAVEWTIKEVAAGRELLKIDAEIARPK